MQNLARNNSDFNLSRKNSQQAVIAKAICFVGILWKPVFTSFQMALLARNECRLPGEFISLHKRTYYGTFESRATSTVTLLLRSIFVLRMCFTTT